MFILIAALAVVSTFNGQIAAAKTEPTVSGTWYGDFTMTAPDGKVSHDKAVLILRQEGSILSGSAGATVDQQSPLNDGHAENGRIYFHLDAAGGLDFELQLYGGHLRGTATGTNPQRSIKAALDLQPAPDLMPQKQLTQEISDADLMLFDAFDRCDAAKYGSFLSADLEFYHDRTGKTDRAQNIAAVERRCAEGIQLRRELEADSLVINDVPGYGAIEAGTHRFYSRQPDGSEHLDATAQFLNIWRKENGSWKLVRSVSYNHH